MTDSPWRPGSLARVALLGAVGGAINAWLCFQQWPVPAGEEHDPFKFGWLVVPGGAIHGGILALMPIWGASRMSNLTAWSRTVLAVPLAWLTGYLSWIPLNRWAADESWSKSATWVFHERNWTSWLWTPFLYFGFVALIYCLGLSLGGIRSKLRSVHMGLAVGAGVLGSMWWWTAWKPWYFAVLHGFIWGILVGAGVWATVATAAQGKPRVA